MSVRVDTASLIAGACVVGNRGLGVLGAVIRATTATGSHGPGYLYNDLTGADDAKEIRGLILTVPSAGTFTPNEDGSFTLTGAPDGSYSFTYRLFADGADLGTATGSITIGAAGVSVTASVIGTIAGIVAASVTVSTGPTAATSVTLTLTTDGTTPAASLSGLKWAFFDEALPSTFTAPVAQGSAEATDGSGVLVLDITGSSLNAGDTGWLIVTNSDGTTTQGAAARAFSGPVTVA